jgi:hypothetical protein
VTIDRARLLAVRAGLQPTFVLSEREQQAFFQRLKKISSAQVFQNNGPWFVQVKKNDE